MATKEQIRKIIYLQGCQRWALSNGMTENALVADLTMDLKRFDTDVLEEAFHEVRRNHHFPTWPTSGEFYKAASQIYSENPKVSGDFSDQMQRSKAAHDYAQAFCNGKNLNRWAKACHANGTVKSLYDFVLQKAFLSLRAHRNPHVREWQAELEQEMAKWDVAVQEWARNNPTPQRLTDATEQILKEFRAQNV